MSSLDVENWERLMAEVVEAHEQADYMPGVVQAPGEGTEGDDPLGLHYADLGPLAFVLNEAIDSMTGRGTDRETLLEQIAQQAGEGIAVADAEDVLTDDLHCPPMELLQAFGQVLSIDVEIIVDAARKGGCTNLGPVPSAPPGF